MPLLQTSTIASYYRLDGADDRPVLILSHSLGQDHGMWDPQIGDLSPHFRLLRYDLRGHGASDAPAGEYRMEQLADDVIALADAVGVDRFAFCGLSIGGMIGQLLAARARGRLDALVLANSSPRPDAAAMETRRRAVLEGGIASVADAVMGRFFSPRSVAANPPHVAAARRTLLATRPVGYAGCCAAVRDMDATGVLASIDVPTLVISGGRDVSLPWTGHGERLARDIPGARVVHLPTAHLSNLEAPRSFTAALYAFLPAVLSDASLNLLRAAPGAIDAGDRMRRAVLGDAYVERAAASTSDFTRAFQELITRFAWGAIWTRPGLDVRTRRLLVLAATASLGRLDEFRLHVRAGLDGGMERCDLEEVLLQTAVYAGVPAANAAFHIAAEELQRAEVPGS